MQESLRLTKGADRKSPVSGPTQVIHRLDRLASQLKVPGDQAQVFTDAFTRIRLQPGSHLGMVHPPQTQQHRLIGHIAQNSVLENILLRPCEGRMPTVKDQLAPFHCAQQRPGIAERVGFPRCILCCVLHGLHSRIPEHPPHHRGALQERFFVGWQAVEAGLQHTRKRGRHACLLQLPQVCRPVLRISLHHPILDQHLDQLFNIKRIALGALHNQIHQRFRRVFHLLQDLAYQLAAVSGGQRP